MDPEELFDLDADRPELSGAVLLHALDGFVDAGSAVQLARSALLPDDAPVVARFDLDQLYDYRARRPVMRFDVDRWTDYDTPQLTVRLLHDQDETPYLLLAGPEPDRQWERYSAAVALLVERLGVRLVVGLDAFPMSVPHTRPTPIIVHGSRRELFADYRAWLGQIMVPASAGHLVEYRLGAAGVDTLGIAAPVPPYLAQAEYPAAALALLREVGARAGLRFDTSSLEDAEGVNRTAIERQVAASTELQTLIAAIEQQYDAAAEARAALTDGDLPSADELGAELERFLADESRGD
ncbi:PAC2 family protein [Jatrophihabitans endophyticus]|uniref:PAC2 family protein n=1 Tax=Jatrophihabitans endophyticus TaxID=1206085 RepID=A0A1M5DNZ8_9ACTN|nr:PAC2 family protein [Jatrophihabitans endophyticus]